MEIYYIEDDGQIGELVKEYLEQRQCRVSLFSSMASAKKALESHIPQIIVADRNMPDGRGEELCRWVRSRWESLPFMFLTVRDDTRDIVSGFEYGADDYVVKPFELEVLYSRIRALLRRSTGKNERYLTCGSITMDLEKMTVYSGEKEPVLSPAEYELLRILLENKGRTVTRNVLLDRIWDQSGNYVNDNTLTVAVKRLREKLGNPSCFKTVRSFGYRMEETV